MTFFEHFINVAMSNAWIVYDRWARHHAPGLPIAKFGDFMWQLSTELIGAFNDRQRPVGRPPLPLVGVHQHIKPPTVTDVHNDRKRCVPCSRRVDSAVMDKKTTCYCTCGVYVCETDVRCWAEHLVSVRASPARDM